MPNLFYCTRFALSNPSYYATSMPLLQEIQVGGVQGVAELSQD